MSKLPQPWWIVAALIIIVLFFFLGSRSARADVAPALCALTTTPGTRWNVTLPERLAPNPVLVLNRVWDADQPNEGTIRINDFTMPAFGSLGVGANDAREIRLSYEVPLVNWRPGVNTISVTWATNQSPSVHEIRELSVSYTVRPAVPAQGCFVTSRQPNADYWSTRVIWGCSNGVDDYYTNVLVLSPEQVRSLWNMARTAMQNAPIPRQLDPVLRFSPITDPCDIRLLWGAEFGGACL